VNGEDYARAPPGSNRGVFRRGLFLKCERLGHHACCGLPNPVSLVLKNQKIEPQMNRMNADEEDENPVFICVFYLRPSEFICG
jgi:hypothetical protein